MQKRIRSPIGAMTVVAGAALLFAIGYAGGRALDAERIWAGDEPMEPGGSTSSGEAVTPPPDDVTPEPGTTPDTSEPFWDIPYRNAEEQLPDFQGDLNGITVGVREGPVPDCGPLEYLLYDEALGAVEGTYFDLDLESLAPGLVPVIETAETMLCADGTPEWHRIELRGSGEEERISITRHLGLTWWPEWASEGRWQTGMIERRPAALKDQIIPGLLGGATVIVIDPEIAGSTRIKSTSDSVTLEVLSALAKELYK